MTLKEFTDFPWGYVLNSATVFRDEMANFSRYLKAIDKDTLSGYKYTGLGSMFPNLACLAYNLCTTIGGKMTLSDYNGIGPDRNS